MFNIVVTILLLVLFALMEVILTSFRIGKGDRTDDISTKIVITVPLACGAISAFAILVLWDGGSWGVGSIIGALLCIAGILLRLVAKRTLGQGFKVAVATPVKLVQNGIYAYIRHPLYLGIMLIYIGLPLAYGTWWLLLSFALPSIASILYRIPVEEAHLRRTLKAKWIAHAQKTWWFW